MQRYSRTFALNFLLVTKALLTSKPTTSRHFLSKELSLVAVMTFAVSFALWSVFVPTTRAATVTVGSNFPCTYAGLVSAIQQANFNGTVLFAPNCNRIYFGDNGNIRVTDFPITIDGAGVSGGLVLDGGNVNRTAFRRVFDLDFGATLTLKNLTVSNGGGELGQAGGAIRNLNSTLNLINTTFSQNSINLQGGAIVNAGTVNVTDSTFSFNSSNTIGGAIVNVGTLNITNSTFSSNTSNSEGGAIFNTDAGTISVISSTFSFNSANTNGGAINSAGTATVNGSTFNNNSVTSANSTKRGGAIYTTGNLSIVNSSFISNLGLGTSSFGGAVFNGGTISSIANSTFASNSAFYGGALVNISPSGVVDSISNTTFASNNGAGAAIFNQRTIGSLVHTTFAYNASDSNGVIFNSGQLTFRNNIFAASGGVNCNSNLGTVNDQGYNLSTDGTCTNGGTGSQINVANLNLDTLKNNGGATATIALLNGSTANGAVSTGCLATDQRGILRATANCDAGAYELITVTNTNLDSSTTASVYGQSVIFTATVSPNPVSGSVIFSDTTNGVAIGSPVPVVNGVATLNTNALTPGSRAIRAIYTGNSNFTASTSGAVNLTVNKANPVVSLSSSAAASVYGQSVTFTATVSPNTVTGNVVFSNTLTGTAIGNSVPVVNGVVTITTNTLAPGTYSIVAIYGGDSNYNFGSSSPLNLLVSKADTSLTLSSSSNPAAFNSTLTFTATLSVTAPGSGTASGIVSFSDSVSGTLGTAALSNGVATFTTTNLAFGSHVITATYAGNPNFNGSQATVNQIITAGPPNQISTVSGDGQQVVVSQPFTNPLVVRVSDVGNNPVSGVSVSFVAPGSGASGTFVGGSPTYTAVTDASGLVTTTIFTANAVPGSYAVTATVAGVANPISFNLTNLSDCNPLEVKFDMDDNTCGTLRYALSVAGANSPGNKTVTITLAAGSVITVSDTITIPPGVEVTTTGGCMDNQPPIVIQASGNNSGDGLILSGDNSVYEVWVKGFSGRQIVASGGRNVLQCVRASKF
jgi:hypothetical protein